MLNVKVSLKERDFVTYADGRYVEKASFKTDTGGLRTVETILENIQQYLIWVSKSALKEELAKGFDPGYLTKVDNKFASNINNVLPLGKVQYLARQRNIATMIMSAYTKILKLSRRVSGNYMRMNWVFLNNRPIANNQMVLKTVLRELEKNNQIKPGSTFHFVNIAEYARRLETLGVTSQSGSLKGYVNKSRHVDAGVTKQGKQRRGKKPPNGTYWNAFKSMRGELAVLGARSVRFEMIPGNYHGIGTFSLSQGAKRNTFASAGSGKMGRPYLYPMIHISIQEQGFVPRGSLA